MSRWSADSVLLLAPDASSAKAGKELAAQRHWLILGANDASLWGECKGSGANPYQIQVDLSGPAFKCSCPSRKFPCKHGLALLLLYAASPSSFTRGEPPDHVVIWLESRAQRGEKKESPPEVKSAPDALAQAKRTAQRDEKVSAGLEELDRWIADLVRGGLADAQTRPYKFWDSMSARLIDSQAPGLARMVAKLGNIPSSGAAWQERMLAAVCNIQLLIESWRGIEILPAVRQADIRGRIGFTVSQSELLSEDGAADQWHVMGVVVEEEERLRAHRSWLRGRRIGRTAMILEYSHASQPAASSFLAGDVYDAELVYYPGASALRAVVKTKSLLSAGQTAQLPGAGETICDCDSASRIAFAEDPWIEKFPCTLAAATPVRRGERWYLQDSTGTTPMDLPAPAAWKLAALSGGHPIPVFGEWDGRFLKPLTAWYGGRAWNL